MKLSNVYLRELYLTRQLSVAQIAHRVGCSQTKINYWLKKYGIPKRSIADATYIRINPSGDPFKQARALRVNDDFLLGLGLGLYWGEGTKRNKAAVRLGNSDPDLIRLFLIFLEREFNVDRTRFRFALQLFSDMDIEIAERYWRRKLGVGKRQFYKTIVTQTGRLGTYRLKTQYGVLTVYFSNRKLRDLLIGEIDRLKEFR